MTTAHVSRSTLLAREAFDYEENGHGGWSVYAYEPDGTRIWLSEHMSDTDARNEVETLVRVTSLWMEV